MRMDFQGILENTCGTILMAVAITSLRAVSAYKESVFLGVTLDGCVFSFVRRFVLACGG